MKIPDLCNHHQIRICTFTLRVGIHGVQGVLCDARRDKRCFTTSKFKYKWQILRKNQAGLVNELRISPVFLSLTAGGPRVERAV